MVDICESDAYSDDLSIDVECLIELNGNFERLGTVERVGVEENSKGVEYEWSNMSESVEGELECDIEDRIGPEIFLSFVKDIESGVC